MLNALMRFFGSSGDEDVENVYDEEPSFVWNENMRIVLAIAVAIGAACFMWWIVA